MMSIVRETANKTNEDLLYYEKKLKELGYEVITATEKRQVYLQSSAGRTLERLLETVKMQLEQENQVKSTSIEDK